MFDAKCTKFLPFKEKVNIIYIKDELLYDTKLNVSGQLCTIILMSFRPISEGY